MTGLCWTVAYWRAMILHCNKNMGASFTSRIQVAFSWDPYSLGIYRIIFGVLMLAFFKPSFGWLGDMPATLFDPPLLSMANLFLRFPSAWVFNLLDVLVTLALVFMTLGFLTRLATLLYLGAFVFGSSFAFSFGKIDHTILLLLVPFSMLFGQWGSTWSLDALLGKQRAAGADDRSLTLLAVLIAFAFFTAAYGKALAWLDFDLATSGVRCWLQSGYYTLDRTMLLAPYAISFNVPLVWELMDISAVLLELGFLAALFYRRSWWIWVALWCGFHGLNTLILNIPFGINIVAVLAFVPWSHIITNRGAGLNLGIQPLRVLLVLTTLIFIAGRTGWVIHELSFPLGISVDELKLLAVAVVWFMLCAAFAFMAMYTKAWKRLNDQLVHS